MKLVIIKLLSLTIISTAMAGGDFGGGPRLISLNKQDTHVNIKDLKLSKDKETVELTVAYKMVRSGINPLLTEEENKKLRLGKYKTIVHKYDKELFHQDTIDKLSKRKKFLFFKKKKYKRLARKYFQLERIREKKRGDIEYIQYELSFK